MSPGCHLGAWHDFRGPATLPAAGGWRPPAGRARRLGLHELVPGESRAEGIGLRVVAGGRRHAFAEELAGTYEDAEVLVFDLFLDGRSGAGIGMLGLPFVRYRCAAMTLTRPQPWLAVTGRRGARWLYPGLEPGRLATGHARTDRRCRAFSTTPEAERLLGLPEVGSWLSEFVSARIENSRSSLILELHGAHAMLAVRACDITPSDEFMLDAAAQHGGQGPWPDELLPRLTALRTVLAALPDDDRHGPWRTPAGAILAGGQRARAVNPAEPTHESKLWSAAT